MKITNQFPNERRGSRPGFTLLELIIVIAIIAVLAALATGVAMRFFAIQQQRNTEVTITKINVTLERQWQAVIDQANSETPQLTSPPSPEYLAYNYVLTTLAGGDANRARVIWIKLRLKQEFPMNFAEILTPQNLSMTPPVQVLPPLSTYVQALKNAVPPPGGIAVTPGDPPTPAENSACLLLALSKARGGIVFNPEDLASNVVADTDLNGLNELVDGWRQPIVFYRWPFGNQELQNLNPAVPGSRESAFADPEDPEGRLVTPNPYNPYPTLVPGAWWTGTGRLYFEMLCHSVSLPNPPVPPLFQPNPPFPKEYYMVPVIASAGPNKSYGLLPAVNTFGSPYPSPFWPNPMLPDGSGDDNDNIYSYRLRLGAQGN